MAESVLVLQSIQLINREGLVNDIPRLDYIISKSVFKDREEAEVDESFRQLIPYVLIKSGDSYLVYNRDKIGGEKRLDNKLSLGVGGHINPIDSDDTVGLNTVINAALRELEEELDYPAELITKDKLEGPLNLICLSTTPVDKVHCGIVFKLEVDKSKFRGMKEGNTWSFKTKEDITTITDKLELWSKWVSIMLNTKEEVSEKETPYQAKLKERGARVNAARERSKTVLDSANEELKD